MRDRSHLPVTIILSAHMANMASHLLCMHGFLRFEKLVDDYGSARRGESIQIQMKGGGGGGGVWGPHTQGPV